MRWVLIFLYCFKTSNSFVRTTRKILGYILLRDKDKELNSTITRRNDSKPTKKLIKKGKPSALKKKKKNKRSKRKVKSKRVRIKNRRRNFESRQEEEGQDQDTKRDLLLQSSERDLKKRSARLISKGQKRNSLVQDVELASPVMSPDIYALKQITEEEVDHKYIKTRKEKIKIENPSKIPFFSSPLIAQEESKNNKEFGMLFKIKKGSRINLGPVLEES